MGPDGAAVTHTLSDDTAQLTKPEWDALSGQTVCLLYDDFAWVRATIEKLCSDAKGACRPEVKAKLAKFRERTVLAALKSRRRERSK